MHVAFQYVLVLCTCNKLLSVKLRITGEAVYNIKSYTASISKVYCQYCKNAIKRNMTPLNCSNCHLKVHKQCTKLRKTIASYFATCSGANSNQWLCQECKFSLFPVHSLSNEEFLIEQNSANDSTLTDYVCRNANANI